MAKPFDKALPGLMIVACIATHSLATGFYGPSDYLEQGGRSVMGTPEFYWDLEVKRLAKEFHPTEKLVVGAAGKARSEEYEAALKAGEFKPADEPDCEFADYDSGAEAYGLGKEHWEEARKAWEKLLARPAAERRYRSVWAAFMLGKLALKNGDPEAVKWFRQTRELASQGFADSLGLAADSYGWEGRSEWKQGHPEKAAPLFLTQLALGDKSAIVSLKALIPDREPVEGMLNYGPEFEDIQKWTGEQKKAQEQKTLLALKTAAADPLLRRLVTVHILATETVRDFYAESRNQPVSRGARWYSVIKDAKIGAVADAEYLGWVAYNNGDYKGAAHWLELAQNDAPAACWLRAKLLLRAGKLNEAAKSMAKAWESIRNLSVYTGSGADDSDEESSDYIIRPDGGDWTFQQSAGGDLAALHLERGDFVQALDTFRKGGIWDDAAFVAERVLTANELKAYVDRQPAPSAPPKQDDSGRADHKEDIAGLRYLLGRRLVREDRYAEAASYLPAPYDKILGKYVQALKDGANEKLPGQQRARAWFTAAWLARHDGMELMGTEVSPDGFEFEGSFPNEDIAHERLTGRYVAEGSGEDQVKKPATAQILLKPSKQELARLTANKIRPDIRYHYRLVAAALAVKAAGFLDDNTEELADVMNAAGLWVKDRDEKGGDRYYQILERRCANTKIGRAAIARHWFVDDEGPWSQEQKTAYDAMHKELDPRKQAE
jgi:hypothetical protein